jgi:hypothetical protein
MASNVSLETDAADNWKPSKNKSQERIDGIVALIMGLDRATSEESLTGPSGYRRMGCFCDVERKQRPVKPETSIIVASTTAHLSFNRLRGDRIK